MIDKNSTKNKRLTILTDVDQKVIFGLPKIEAKEYQIYFNVDPDFRLDFDRLPTMESQLFFVLQLGLFRKSLKFFTIDLYQVEEEIKYISERYFLEESIMDLQVLSINKKARLQHQKIIMGRFSFRRYSSLEEKRVLKQIAKSVSIDSNPKYVFNEMANFFIKDKMILPAYSTVQDLISKGILIEEKRVFQYLAETLKPAMNLKIDRLHQRAKNNRYFLSILKAPIKGFDYKYAVTERAKLEEMHNIYKVSKAIIKHLAISNHSIQYFAELVSQYQIGQLQQTDLIRSRFLLLCFVNYRYRVSNDNLTKTFIHLMGKWG